MATMDDGLLLSRTYEGAQIYSIGFLTLYGNVRAVWISY